MKQTYSYEELKELISTIKTPKELTVEKETNLKYKIIHSYYNHSIDRHERNILLDLLSLKLYEVFGV